jgi:hypothetical protein
VPDARAGLVQAEIGFSQWFPADPSQQSTIVGGSAVVTSTAGWYTAQIGGAVDVPNFASLISTTWLHNPSGGTHDAAYHLARYNRGQMWTGLVRHVTRAQLATVQVTEAQTVPRTTGSSAVYRSLNGVLWRISWPEPGLAGPLPLIGTDFYNTDAGVQFEDNMTEDLDITTNVQWQAGAHHVTGRAGLHPAVERCGARTGLPVRAGPDPLVHPQGRHR